MPVNQPLRDWTGRVVWIVGASSGIGLATAEALARRGAKVVVSARKAAPLEAFAAAHPGAMALPLDAAAPGALKAGMAQLLARHGRLDLALYCAGHYLPVRATAYDLDEVIRHQDINVTGAMRMLDAVLPTLLAQRSGHISLVASVAGYRGLPQSLAYGPTKAALTNLAENLYLDLQPQGLGVSVVHPGFVQTPLTAQNAFAMPALITPEQAAQAMLDGWAAGAFDIHYPKRFTRWMKLLRVLPHRLYFPLVRRFTGL